MESLKLDFSLDSIKTNSDVGRLLLITASQPIMAALNRNLLANLLPPDHTGVDYIGTNYHIESMANNEIRVYL